MRHRHAPAWAACLALALLGAGAAIATPGALDPSFSEDGRLTIEREGEATPMAVRPDGTVLLAGCANREHPRLLTRISPDGSAIDKRGFAPSFGCARDAQLQPDGSLVVVGSGPTGRCLVARFTATRRLDPAFSGDGMRRVRFADGRSFGSCPAIAAGPGGRVVILGDRGHGPRGAYHFALARLMPNGAFDRGFSGDGRVVGRFRTNVRAGAPRDLAIQPDGRVVVAGKSVNFVVARLTADGHLDGSFSYDGRRILGVGDIGGANAVAVQPDGRLLVAGDVFLGNSERFRRLAVYRLTRGGDLDQGFADYGRLYGHVGPDLASDTAVAVAVQNDRGIVLAGSATSAAAGARSDFALMRLTPAGLPDDSFSADGYLPIGFEGIDGGEGADFAERLAIQAGGRIVVVGISEPGVSVARVEAD